MKQLIVNADDFGRSPGVVRGILEAHHKGIVTSTTVMINYPAAPQGLEQALASALRLGIGLHLNVTSGRPVSDPAAVPSLVDERGVFHFIADWGHRIDAFDPDDLRREVMAQFDRFVSLTGRIPDHLDAHHHATYLHPASLRVMLELAAEHGLPMRDAYFDAPERAFGALRGMIPSMSEDRAWALLDDLRAVLAESPAAWCPARFHQEWYDSTATLGDLLVILTTLEPDSVTELMCHPGYVDEALADSGYIHPREDEIAHLTHAATRECVQSEGIRLITFADLERTIQ